METAALNAVAGRPKEEYGMEPQSLDEVRPGCYDVHERVKDMDAGGVLASMNFPSFPTFTARTLLSDDLDLSLRWCRRTTTGTSTSGAAPTRGGSSRWRSRSSGTSSRPQPRSGGAPTKGCHSLSFTENPAALGYPSFHDEYWDPVWKACCDTGTVLSIHLGSSGRLRPGRRLPARRDDHAAADEHPVRGGRPAVVAGAEELPGPAGRAVRGRHRLDPVLPDRVDRTFEMHRAWTQQDFGGRLPSEVFREHFLTCFISDPVGVELRERIGVDNIAWEADYPHSDSMWPTAPEELADDVRRRTPCPTTTSAR